METENYWKCGEQSVTLGKHSVIVGILNVTPDSFSDGGSYALAEAAVGRALKMFDDGARVVDVGGESTRPGFEPVPESEEMDRVEPVIRSILKMSPHALLSVDTSKAAVARAALRAGARVVNDVWGFQKDAQLAGVAAEHRAGVVLMRNGREDHSGGSILDRIRESWERSVELALQAGIESERIALDPGLGFGTSRQEELEILRELGVLRAFGFPMMLGASRKRITAEPRGLALGQRMETTLATTVAGIAAGVEIFRVHDVAENVRAAGLADLIYRGGELHE